MATFKIGQHALLIGQAWQNSILRPAVGTVVKIASPLMQCPCPMDCIWRRGFYVIESELLRWNLPPGNARWYDDGSAPAISAWLMKLDGTAEPVTEPVDVPVRETA